MNARVTCPVSVFSLHHFPKSIMHLSWRAGSSFTSNARWCRIRCTSALHSRDSYQRQIWTFGMNKPTHSKTLGFFFQMQTPILLLFLAKPSVRLNIVSFGSYFLCSSLPILTFTDIWMAKKYLIRKYLNKLQGGSNWTNQVKLQFLL